MVRHPVSGVRMPRLTRLADAAVRDTVNARLDAVAADFTCGDPSGDPASDSLARAEHWTSEATARVAFLSRDALSVTVGFYHNCGGAYPNYGTLGRTYSLATGGEVALESLFSNFERDRPAILRALYGDVLDEALRRVATLDPERPERDCADVIARTYGDDAGAPYSFNFALTPRGVRVWPEFPHVIQACAEENEVPYARLLPFTAPNSLLRRVAGRAR